MSIDLHRDCKTSFYINHIKMRNYYNIYRGIQGNTGEYRGIQGNTKEYRRMQKKNAGEYRGIQSNTG